MLLVPGVARDGVSYQQCFERSIVEIKKAIPVAKETGVRIAIENVGNNFILAPEQAVWHSSSRGGIETVKVTGSAQAGF